MKIQKIILLVFELVALAGWVGCAGVNEGDEDSLEASGIISVESINISPEVGGMVSDVFVDEGQEVEAGDLLFSIDNEIYLAQYDQVEAAVKAAKANVEAANAQLASAEIQYELVLQSALLGEGDGRNSLWFFPSPVEIELPEWYFSKSDRISALEKIIESSSANLKNRETHLSDVLGEASKDDFRLVEERLANAQISFQIASQALELSGAVQSNEELLLVAEKEYDASLAELENVQQEYNKILSTTSAKEVLEARAQVAVSQLLYEKAQDQLMLLLSGNESIQVKAAQAGINQAQTAVVQAEANLNQANAALTLIEIQMKKTKIVSPIPGTVLIQNLNVGELVGPGGIVMRIGNLDEVKLLVYVPEDRYGKVQLNQEVVVTVDSFPNKSYSGFVIFISDQAEFTPSNIQTVEGRKATVYSVEIVIDNPNHDLKPGMPADVMFIEE